MYYRFLVFALLFSTAVAAPLEELGLEMLVTVERQLKPKDEWSVATVEKFHGIGGMQAELEPNVPYRMVIAVQKPYDLKGTMRVRTPSQSGGMVMAPGESETRYILERIGEPDAGNIEVRVDLPGAKQSSFGLFVFRPFSARLKASFKPALTYSSTPVSCGSVVKAGLWLFAKPLEALAEDAISFCMETPDGTRDCDASKKALRTPAEQHGTYKVTLWNDTPSYQTCEVTAQ